TVGAGMMIGSFRGTVVVWLEQSLGGDIQVGGGEIDAELARTLASLPGVAAARELVMHEVESARGPLRLQAAASAAQELFYLKDAAVADLEAWRRGEGILISEPLASLEALSPGDTLEVFT